MTSPPAAVPPRVLIVMPDQWRRALLRAALREVGYDAVGTRALPSGLLIRPAVAGRGPVRLLVIDQDALNESTGGGVDALRTRHRNPDILLLARSTIAPPPGPWTKVLRRPLSVSDLVAAVDQLLPLPVALHHPVD